MIGESFDGVILAARTGADWAWTTLYRDLAPVVLGYLRAQRAAEPEDLTAEVFFQVVKSLNQFSGDEAAFRSWVFVIAHRKLLDDRRSRARRPVEPADAEKIGANAAMGDVEQDTMRALGNERVRRLLDGLTADQADVLLLRIIGDLSVNEVAQAMGKRTGAIKALQQRGLCRIRQRISDGAVSI
ncbi:MAG: RNA polymerase sigma factor [Actinomycetota bacterium]